LIYKASYDLASSVHESLDTGGVAGVESAFTIHTYDMHGNACYNDEVGRWAVQLDPM
jgi:hypothetical protein